MSPHPTFTVAVVMRREAISGPMSRWQSHRWVLHDVLADDGQWGHQAKPWRHDPALSLWVHPAQHAGLHPDDAEGYYLNLTSPAPCWFVMWRMQEVPECAPEPMAVPVMVSLSYHDAGRWLDAQETVEQVPMQPDVLAQVRAFVEAYWKAEPKTRQRPQSFQALTDRFGQPARVSTGKHHGGQ